MKPKTKVKETLSNVFNALTGKKGKGAQALGGVTILAAGAAAAFSVVAWPIPAAIFAAHVPLYAYGSYRYATGKPPKKLGKLFSGHKKKL